jgi:hypothetical protein
MQKLALICLCALSLWACSRENRLQLNNSPRALALLPAVNASGVRYFSSAGDTLILKKASQYTTYNESAPLNGNIGGSENIETVVLETTHLILRCDSPSFRFIFKLSAVQNLNVARGSLDAFSLQWEQNALTTDSYLNLLVSDSIRCDNTPLCTYGDTLSLSGVKQYTDVYFTERSGSNTRLFLNENEGLIGFTTEDQTTFERIP